MTDPPFGFGMPRDPDEGSGGSGNTPAGRRRAARSARSATRSSSPRPCGSSPT